MTDRSKSIDEIRVNKQGVSGKYISNRPVNNTAELLYFSLRTLICAIKTIYINNNSGCVHAILMFTVHAKHNSLTLDGSCATKTYSV